MTTINLQYLWHTMNGNQKIERKLMMTLLARKGSQNASLVSAMFMYELKENKTEYIIGKTNSSASSPTLPQKVNLETKYFQPSRTTVLNNAILTIEHLSMSFPDTQGSREGRNLDKTGQNMDKINQRSSKPKSVGNKCKCHANSVLTLLFMIVISFCFIN
jgi:hypothetical protein